MLIAILAGILITEEVMSVEAGIPRKIYAARTEPEMVLKPEVMVRWISEGVIRSA